MTTDVESNTGGGPDEDGKLLESASGTGEETGESVDSEDPSGVLERDGVPGGDGSAPDPYTAEREDETGPYRLPSWLLVGGIVATLIAVSTSWTSSDPTLRRLLDGPTNGWIPLLSSVLALLVFSRFRQGRWPAIIAITLVSFGALSRVVTSQALESFERTWGWWVGLAGAGMLLAAAIIAAAVRIGSRRRQPLFRWPRGFRQVGGIVGLILVILGLWVMEELLEVTEVVSWPPGPDAITAEDAQDRTEAFASENRHPFDIAQEYDWTTADTMEAWPDGVEFFPRIFADLEAAESSIHIMMFGWKSGEVGTELADLLVAKLDEGVEVRILVDAVGSGPYGASNEMYQQLVGAGAELVVNDTLPVDEDASAALSIPVSDSNGDEVGRAEHRKLYVVDGEVVWTGGAGIEDHFRNGEFHDVMVRVTGDIVKSVQAVFLTSFASHDATLPDSLDEYFPEPADPGDIPITVVQTVPGGFSSATQQAREMIDDAESRLDIMNPYLTDEDIVDRIVGAAERGVDVRLFLSEEGNNAAAQRAIKSFYPRLLDAGVEVWLYPDAVVHAKVIVADDLVHIGTLNLDAWSLYRDFEIALVAASPETADLFRERIFEPDIAVSSPAEKPVGWEQFVNWIYYKLTWFL